MNKKLIDKLAQMSAKLDSLNVELSSAEAVKNQDRFRQLSIEHANIAPIVNQFNSYQKTTQNIQDLENMTTDKDADMRLMAEDELKNSRAELVKLELDLKRLLLPKDPNNERDIIIEIRAGTGGDEASIFVGDLFKMYARYVEKQRKWQIETISQNPGDHGGFKEIIAKISGVDVFSKLRFESGAHRVQRVPTTESQGRIHTSACTVAVMPEVTSIDEIDIDISDVKIDTFRASGAGGQHVNKTDSAIRVTHIPTGTVVECQDGRSQHKNKAQALSVLASRILDQQQQAQQKAQASERKALVGSGDRSERIRTYNYPQGRITDHRINLSLYKLNEIMEGDLAVVIEPLIVSRQTDLLVTLDTL